MRILSKKLSGLSPNLRAILTAFFCLTVEIIMLAIFFVGISNIFFLLSDPGNSEARAQTYSTFFFIITSLIVFLGSLAGLFIGFQAATPANLKQAFVLSVVIGLVQATFCFAAVPVVMLLSWFGVNILFPAAVFLTLAIALIFGAARILWSSEESSGSV